MQKKLLFTCFTLQILVFSANAYIEGLSVCRNDKQLLYSCAEIHDYSNPANYEQKIKIHNIIKGLDTQSVSILAEDPKEYSGDDSQIECFIKGRAAVSPQSGIMSFARELGLEAVNLEYRFARMAAILPFLQEKRVNNDIYEYPIPVGKVVDEFDAAKKTIEGFDDGPILKDYYSHHIHEVYDKNCGILQDIKGFSGTFIDYLVDRISPEKHLAFAQLLYLWDFRLLDLIAIHEIIKRRDKKKLYLFAGCLHVSLIVKILENELCFNKEKVIGIAGKETDKYNSYLLDTHSSDFDIQYKQSCERKSPSGPPLSCESLMMLTEDTFTFDQTLLDWCSIL